MRVTAIALVVFLASCTKPNPNRCCNDEADCNAKGIPVGSICEQGLVCRGNQCIAQPCSGALDCDAAAPYCVAELCAEACAEDSHCPGNGQDASRAFCVSGTCVTCRDDSACGGSAPVCEQGSCRACRSHAECDSQICDAGTCIAETEIAYAAPNGSSTSTCTLAEPCTLDRAVTVISPARPNIKLLPGVHILPNGALTITGSFTASMYGPATVQGFIEERGSGGAITLRVRDLSIQGQIECDSDGLQPVTVLELDRVSVESSTGAYPVQAYKCKLTIRDSSVRALADLGPALVGTSFGSTDGQPIRIERSILRAFEGGSQISGASVIRYEYGVTLDIENSVIRGGSPTQGAFSFGTNAGTVNVGFTTFVNTFLKCPNANIFFMSHDNIFLNELPGAPSDTVTGTACSHRYVLVRPQATAPPGTGNLINLDPRLANVAQGDYHLLAGSPAIDAADPGATEAADFEGTSRPQGAGRDLGAFEYH